MFNPHFQHCFSPEAMDMELGGVQFRPAVPARLLLDSFAPTEQAQILAQAAAHCSVVWVTPDQQSVTAASDLISLRCFQSRLVALLPAKSMVLNPVSVACWQKSLWDSAPARFASQLWQMSSHAVNPAVPLQPPDVHSGLGCWQRRRFDFHSLSAKAPKGLLCYRAGQEDSRQWAHAGIVSGC